MDELREPEFVVSDSEVVKWRHEVLTEVGFDPFTAGVLAARADIDVHKVCDMVARGATHSQALAIVL